MFLDKGKNDVYLVIMIKLTNMKQTCLQINEGWSLWCIAVKWCFESVVSVVYFLILKQASTKRWFGLMHFNWKPWCNSKLSAISWQSCLPTGLYYSTYYQVLLYCTYSFITVYNLLSTARMRVSYFQFRSGSRGRLTGPTARRHAMHRSIMHASVYSSYPACGHFSGRVVFRRRHGRSWVPFPCFGS